MDFLEANILVSDIFALTGKVHIPVIHVILMDQNFFRLSAEQFDLGDHVLYKVVVLLKLLYVHEILLVQEHYHFEPYAWRNDVEEAGKFKLRLHRRVIADDIISYSLSGVLGNTEVDHC